MSNDPQASASLATQAGCVLLVDGRGYICGLDQVAGLALGRIGIQDTSACLLKTGPLAMRRVVRRAMGDPPLTSSVSLETDERFYELRACPLEKGPAEARIAVLIRDLTFERRLEERCLALERYEGFDRLIASVAHDVRNPLAASTTLVETVQLQSDLTPEASRRLGDAVNHIERASDLLNNLVRYSRNDMPTFHPHSMTRIVEEVVQLQRTAVQRRGVELRTTLDPDLPPVYADPGQLRQILVNLITNATDAIESAGRQGVVSITTSSRLGIVRLIVEDDGPGIPPEIAQRIFTPFFTTKPPEKGTGLGLAISYGVAKAHGGHLWYRPSRNQGSSFVLDLPDPRFMVPAKEKAFLGVSSTTLPAASALLVEPEARQLETASQFLRRNGYRVHVATSGGGALRKLAATRFDLVLCAYDMGDMAADDFLRQALKTDAAYARRLAFTTSEPDSNEFRELLANTSLPWIEKPFGAHELEELLERLEQYEQVGV